MRRQDQWQNMKNYSGHLKRLTNIRHSSISPKDTNQTLGDSLQKSKIKIIKPRRCITYSSDKPKSLQKALPLTLPLIAQSERQLISKSLSVCKIPHREEVILLQNYLLNKRLLGVKPSISKLHHDKEYERHERYSHLRSKSKLDQIKLSQSRLLKFKEFEHAQRRRVSSRLSTALGSGKYLFSLKITSLQRINRKMNQGILYNLVLKIGKKSFSYKHLSLRNFYENRSFYFRKKDFEYPNLLFGELEEIVQNQSKKIGTFSIDLNDVYNQMSSLEKSQDYRFERVEEVEGITSMRSELLVGTITFNYTITKDKR